MRTSLLAAILLAAFAGCSEPALDLDAGLSGADATFDAAVDAGLTDAALADATPERSFFAREHLTNIEVELAPDDWDALRRQSRTLATTLAREECLEEPFASPYTYFPAKVTIDGQHFERVGVRKKGFLGSLSEIKPSLKIKLDEYTDGEYLGVSTLTLNNGNQDPALVRPCLGYDVFRSAGVAAPECAFAAITVNGTPLGPYVNVETINKRFLRRAFGDDEGQLYEGTLSDFKTGWLGTFEQETNDAVPYDRSDLLALTHALEASDDALLAGLEPLVDLETFQRFWAAEVLIEHWDGYSGNANNFYLYRLPSTGRFVFIPSGADGILGSRPAAPVSVFAESWLPRRLYQSPTGRSRYLAALGQLLERGWDPNALGIALARDQATIAPAIFEAERTVRADAARVIGAFIAGRSAALKTELDAGGATWDHPVRDPVCFSEGHFGGEIETTFGTHPAPDVFRTGTGTISYRQSAPIPIRAVGGSSGFGTDPTDKDEVVVILAGVAEDGSIPILYLAIQPAAFVAGAHLPIDNIQVRSALLGIRRVGLPIEVFAAVIGGQIDISAAGTTAGAEVKVGVDAALLIPRPPP